MTQPNGSTGKGRLPVAPPGLAAVKPGRPAGYRFGGFEVDAAAGELRRQGMRIRVHVQPFQVLLMLLARPGEVLTREEISGELWPEGTFVDYEHGVNSAVNRIREALGDSARSPRFIETLARRGYRFVAPVERIGEVSAVVELGAGSEVAGSDVAGSDVAGSDVIGLSRFLARPEELPKVSRRVARTLFVLLQAMYVGYYVGALANLPEIEELFSVLPRATEWLAVLVVTAALLIPVRVFLFSAVLFRAPGIRGRFLRMWPFLLPFDVLWALAPFLLLHHMSAGMALACVAPLVYSPFAQRALMLMGAGERE